MKTPVKIENEDHKFATRQQSERSQEINREVMAKRVLVINHRNDVTNHISGEEDSLSTLKLLLIKHKSEDNKLRADNKRDWNQLLAKQEKELRKHTKANS